MLLVECIISSRGNFADVEDSHLRLELLFQWKADLSILCYHAVPLLTMPLFGLRVKQKRL